MTDGNIDVIVKDFTEQNNVFENNKKETNGKMKNARRWVLDYSEFLILMEKSGLIAITRKIWRNILKNCV
jgi:hypothetical protein